MREYTEKFDMFTVRNTILEDDDQKAPRYVVRLHSQILDVVTIQTIKTVDDAYQLA